jgi:hypothetical protein
VRLGRWKYLRDGAIDLLFDLAADPGERDNLGSREAARMGDLRARVTKWEAEMDASAVEFPFNAGSGGTQRTLPKPVAK